MSNPQPGQAKGDILVVDDHLPNLRVLSAILTEHGYEVRGAPDGTTALMAATAEPPDLVLLDVLMPGMDGYAVCRQLKSAAKTRDIPVIFVSALDEVVDKVKGFETGGVDFITKPFQVEEVLARVNTHLTLHSLQKELEQRVEKRTADLATANASLRAEIAERKRAEAALRKSEEQYRLLVETMNEGLSVTDENEVLTYVNRRLCEMLGYSRDELLGHHSAEFLDEAHQKILAEQLARRRQGDNTPYENVLRRKDGPALFALISPQPIFDDAGEYRGSFAVITDITERVRVEEKLRRYQEHLEELVAERTARLTSANEQLEREIADRKQAEEALQRYVEELATLNRIAQTVATVMDLPAALQRVAEMVAHLFNACTTVITALNADHSELRVLAEFDREHLHPRVVGVVCPIRDVPGMHQMIDPGQSLVVHQAQTSPFLAGFHEYLRAHNIQAVMLVPLRTRGAFVGSMAVSTDQAGRVFTRAEVSLAETIAGDVASAIENARLYQQAQVVAVDEERQRLARELHDSVTQSLYSLTLLTNGWGTMAAQGRLDDAAGCFRQLGEVGQQALKEMRLLIHQLRPPILEEVGLAGALQQRLDTVERRVNVETRLLTRGAVDQLPRAVEEQLFHIAQEALNNTLRHADATAITVRIRAQDGRVVLSVEDNGTGFDQAAVSSGMGFVTMKERAEAVGGRVWVASRSDQGTTVTVTVPIQSDEKV